MVFEQKFEPISSKRMSGLEPSVGKTESWHENYKTFQTKTYKNQYM
jgi:hypothetical protein